jgi:putative peptidoglycan lipid II flippase
VAAQLARVPQKPWRGGSAALLVASGMFLSRISGLVREYLLARYLGGESDAADAWRAAFRIPNFLQNLFGEGVLSASFIPVYAGLLARGKEEEAGRVAGAVVSLLALLVSVLTLLGILATPLLIDVIAYGFQGAKRLLTISLVRILFPGAAMLVMSAWCLGILNSHRRFFLSYSVSVLWNLTIIAALLWFGLKTGEAHMAVVAAWASVAGCAIQVLAQLPLVLQLVPTLRLGLGTQLASVRTVIRNFGPVFVSRGVIQISSYIDSMLASPIQGGVAMYGYVINISQLPQGLFGMAVSASELPAMSSAVGTGSEVAAQLRKRLANGLRRITFFVVPSVVAFAALGDVVVGAVLQSGRFTANDTMWGWRILAGSAVGLLASTQGRLYSSTFYALKDTRTPLRFAVVRIALTTVLGYLCARPIPQWFGLDPRWGVAGLTASAGIAGWVEFTLLRRSLAGRIGSEPVGVSYLARLWASAFVAAAVAWGIRLALPGLHEPKLRAIATLIPYGLVYLLLADPAQIAQRLKALRRA